MLYGLDVVQFESYCPDMHTHTHRTGCSIWTTKVEVNAITRNAAQFIYNS